MLEVAQIFVSFSPTISTLRFRLGLCFRLELLREGHVVEEGPWVVELGIPRAFEISHCLHNPIHLRVANEREECRIDARGALWARRIPLLLPV